MIRNKRAAKERAEEDFIRRVAVREAEHQQLLQQMADTKAYLKKARAQDELWQKFEKATFCIDSEHAQFLMQNPDKRSPSGKCYKCFRKAMKKIDKS